MPDCSTTQLIGYLLDALDEEEREQIEQELARRPELRKKLQRLKDRLGFLDLGRVDVSPPQGLAERTCQLVLQSRQTVLSDCPVSASVGLRKRGQSVDRRVFGFRLSPLGDYWAGHGTNWSFADLAVGTLVVLIVISLLFPALAEVRFRSRVVVCRDNCRELYQTIHQYQDLKDLPGPEGVAQASLAVVGFSRGNAFTWPALRPCPGVVVDADLGGDQASRAFEPAGFTFENQPRRAGLGYLPVTYSSDSSEGWIPSFDQVSLAALPVWRDRPHPRDCEGWSWNHEARGENWLFADGHVVFLPRRGGASQRAILAGMSPATNLGDLPGHFGDVRFAPGLHP